MNEQFKLVFLDNPYAHWHDKFVKSMFCKIIDLKKRCYSKHYHDHYAPIDKWDMHGQHISLCQDIGGELTPLVSMRTVTNKRCESYGFKFNGYNLLSSCEDCEHHHLLNEFIDHTIKNDKVISTTSGLAFEPSITSRDPKKRYIIEMFVPLFVYNYIYGNWDSGVIIGACKSGLNKVYANKIGFNFIKSHNGENLSSINIPSSGNELFDVMTINKPKEAAFNMAFENISLWRNRIHIGDSGFKDNRNSVDDYFKDTFPAAA